MRTSLKCSRSRLASAAKQESSLLLRQTQCVRKICSSSIARSLICQKNSILNHGRRQLSAAANSVLAQTDVVTIPTADVGVPVSVKAYYISKSIDIRRVESNLYGTTREHLHGKSVTITVDRYLNQYISVFEYGSCVFFNIPTLQHSEHLRRIKEASYFDLNSDGPQQQQHTEDYTVIIHDNLDKPSAIKSDHVNIRILDSNNIVIIGTVMAQSVALDYYAALVDEKLEGFKVKNQYVEKSARLGHLDKKQLYKLVGFSNTVTTNVLSKMGFFAGSDATWENADYHITWELLRKEFEMENRFRDLSLKLNLVKDNAR